MKPPLPQDARLLFQDVVGLVLKAIAAVLLALLIAFCIDALRQSDQAPGAAASSASTARVGTALPHLPRAGDAPGAAGPARVLIGPVRPAPEPAVRVADDYALASYTTRTGVASDAWVEKAAQWCSPQWLAALRAGEHVAAVATRSYVPHVVANYPSLASGAEVALTVQLSGQGGLAGPAVVVELDDLRGRFVVVGAQ